MAGAEYIQVAIDNLRRAIAAKQAEIADIRRQIEQEEGMKRQRLESINNQINMDNVQIANPNTNGDQQARLTRQNMELQSEKSHVEHEHSRVRQIRDQEIRDKEQEWRNIERFIGELQNLK